jgi:hypothetical protein
MDADSDLFPIERIEKIIFLVRGRKVILDRDLSTLYGVETRILNQAVRRNRNRFPSDFMFELSREEIMRISQIVTSSGIKFSRKVSAFTEQGVAMLSGVLNSPRAILVNIEIMRAFVRLRQFLASQEKIGKKLEELEMQIQTQDENIKNIFTAIRQLMSPPKQPKRQIGFRVKERGIRYRHYDESSTGTGPQQGCDES